ncbi:MAG TPA: ATPase [Bacteroidales bacterium]|nr:MAG: ATPase [Bacteroidetes bacterium GWF2_35_48]OFY94620.1 MAG: ATPase [Bacteroidetes bacterium RIFOXYC12_FULL_35_7]HBX53521.1 ATPase [Bacteroidales bacterium]
MERKIFEHLLKWKKSKQRLPLLLQGARQVGKTHSLLKFGKEQYKNVVYFNFESNPDLHSLFNNSLAPSRLIPQLSLLSSSEIFPEDSLLIFDEIQSCERAITSLKYFAEEAPAYHVAAAGSLLGVAINRQNFSFPVGKVKIENMFPLDFEEFLWALDKKKAVDVIRDCYCSFSECMLHKEFLDMFQLYISLGGMPRVVNEYIDKHDFDYITSIQKEILIGYIADMSKYAAITETINIMAAYNSIPAQLAKPNKKFQYNIIKSGARAKNYETPIEWLKAAGVIYRVQKCRQPVLPLKAYIVNDYFKIYMNDTGLLCSKYGLNNKNIAKETMQISGIKGVLAENYVSGALHCNGFEPCYWESEGKAEVDFIIQNTNGEIIPIEVKSSENVKSKSLSEYIKRYKPETAYRISTKNFGKENNLLSIPLYAVFCIEQ